MLTKSPSFVHFVLLNRSIHTKWYDIKLSTRSRSSLLAFPPGHQHPAIPPSRSVAFLEQKNVPRYGPALCQEQEKRLLLAFLAPC